MFGSVFFRRLAKTISEHSIQILGVGAIAGIAAVGIISAKNPEDKNQKTALALGFTAGCVVGATIVATKKISGLKQSLADAKTQNRELRQMAERVFGTDGRNKLEDRLALLNQQNIEDPTPINNEHPGWNLYYVEKFRLKVLSSESALLKAEISAEQDFQNAGSVSVGQFFRFWSNNIVEDGGDPIDIPKTDLSWDHMCKGVPVDSLGWSKADGQEYDYNSVQFESRLMSKGENENEPDLYRLVFKTEPDDIPPFFGPFAN